MSIDNLKMVVIQPTSFCNLNCKYCYVPDRKDKTHIAQEVLESLIKKLFIEKTDGYIEFLYHAGEPLTVARSFYENIVELIKQYKPKDLTVTNVIQTNGVLINDAWAEFFLRNDFKIGISIDGPQFLHDNNRKNWSGVGSFEKSLNGFKILKKHGINAGLLSVITSLHLEHVQEFLDFYIENEITDVGFNVEAIDNANLNSSMGNINNEMIDKYNNFISKIFNFAINNSDKIKIREIADTLERLHAIKQDPSYCSSPIETIELGIITVQKNGDITTYCPEFAGMQSNEYNNFVIGNILTLDKLSDLEKSDNYIKITSDYNKRKKKCKDSCEYYAMCGSAFLSNVYSETGSLVETKNASCIVHKQQLVHTIMDMLTKL